MRTRSHRRPVVTPNRLISDPSWVGPISSGRPSRRRVPIHKPVGVDQLLTRRATSRTPRAPAALPAALEAGLAMVRPANSSSHGPTPLPTPPSSADPDIGTVNPAVGPFGASVLRNHSGSPYDVKLTQTEANHNKFFRIQALEDPQGFYLSTHWGRIGSNGQHQLKQFDSKQKAIKGLEQKFRSKAGVAFADRASANQAGKYKTEAEKRVALAGGRTADDKTVCFCLMWHVSGVDLDIHCETPSGQTCFFSNKSPAGTNCSLDVDRMGGAFPNQVENIFLATPGAADGKYRYFVRYYSGMPATINFKFTLNQFGKTVHEGVGIVAKERKDTTCVELTMKNNKVVEVDFGASVTVEERA